ncbi:MAG TPA: 3-dehydroquinate synthase, partial [Geminicoccaceae bacterium]|nr:3-dehydroquinate synthase [Geminicoccaceae bacterium]
MTGAARLTVDLGARSYEIVVGPRLLERAGEELLRVLRRPEVVLVTDEQVARTPHLATLEASLAGAAIASRRFVLPPGEASKSMAELERLLDRILAAGVERSTTLLAFGGGVIGDLAG